MLPLGHSITNPTSGTTHATRWHFPSFCLVRPASCVPHHPCLVSHAGDVSGAWVCVVQTRHGCRPAIINTAEHLLDLASIHRPYQTPQATSKSLLSSKSPLTINNLHLLKLKMSYNDSYGDDRRGGGRDEYGSDHRQNEGGYGGGKDSYGGRQEGGYGGDRRQEGGESYGGGRQEGRDEYGGGRQGGRDEHGGGRQGGRDEYGSGRQDQSYGGGESYGSGGGGGGFGHQSDHNRPEGSYSEGQRYGQGHGDSSGTSYGGGGAYGGASNDFSGAEHEARQHAGNSGDSSLFSTALGMLSGKHQQVQNEGFDEEDAVRQHRNFYGGGGGQQQASSGNLGSAAAMQALKMFNGGGGSSSGQGSSGGGQNAFIGMAMGQAAKLFDQQSSQGNVQGNKQDAVASAAQMALKMYMKSEMGGGGSSGGSGGGMGGLMSLASKFLK